MDCSSDSVEPPPKKLKLEISKGPHQSPEVSSLQISSSLSVDTVKQFLTSNSFATFKDLADNLSEIRLNRNETLVINAPTNIISQWSVDTIPCLTIFAQNYVKQQLLCQWTSTLLAALRQIPHCAVRIKVSAEQSPSVNCRTDSRTFLRCKIWRFLLNFKSLMPPYLCCFLEAEFKQSLDRWSNPNESSYISSQSHRTPRSICQKVIDKSIS